MNDARCRVRVCRDCCCGTTRKHPGVDHDGLLSRLSDRVGAGADVSETTCLLACELSNVVVVTPSRTGRRAGGRAVWLREVLDRATVDAIASWVTAGGPGVARVPAVLAAHRCQPPRHLDDGSRTESLPAAVMEP